MRRSICIWFSACVLVLVGGQRIRAAELSVEAYWELSVARLQLAEEAWGQASRSPTADEEARLWQRYGTTAAEYYAFGSTHRDEVAQYLAAYPDIGAEVERLSARLEELIEQAEAR
jgi:hypothetical protein